MITIKDLNDRDAWYDFEDSLDSGMYFLQSWLWGDFNSEGLSKRTQRIGAYDGDNNLVAIALVIFEETRFGTYAYIPRGPMMDWDADYVDEVIEALKVFYSSQDLLMLKIEPRVEKSKQSNFNGANSSYKYTQSQRNWVIDLKEDEDEQWKFLKENGMRSNYKRYINRASKLGVKIEMSARPEAVGDFWDVLQQTSKRKNMTTYPKSYYEKQIEILGEEGTCRIFRAVGPEGELLASALIAFSQDEAAYLHGASADGEFARNSRAAHLMHWEIMRTAATEGMSTYNMWGVLDLDKNGEMDKSHGGYGFSLFKRSFGGRFVEYMDTQDFVYNRLKYTLLSLQERYRKWRFGGHFT